MQRQNLYFICCLFTCTYNCISFLRQRMVSWFMGKISASCPKPIILFTIKRIPKFEPQNGVMCYSWIAFFKLKWTVHLLLPQWLPIFHFVTENQRNTENWITWGSISSHFTTMTKRVKNTHKINAKQYIWVSLEKGIWCSNK